MAEIDNLEIRVASDADVASKALERLASSASRVRGAARGATDSVRGFTGAVREDTTEVARSHTETGRAERSMRSFGDSAEAAGKAAKKGSNGIAAFWGKLKQVAYYRFIRSIIKGIVSAFKEGITNLYNWDNAVNGRFAKSMDKIATSTQYLKNALGTLVAPLINTFAPILDYVVDRIVDVINWVNRLIAALSGAQTYTVAKKVATKWGEAGKSVAGSARSAAQDIKRTLLGFDEINKLDKPNSGSSGGGSGSSSGAKDYTNMFETRAVGDDWMSAATKIKLAAKVALQGIGGFAEGAKTLMANLTTAFNFFKGIFDGIMTVATQFGKGVTAVVQPVVTLVTGIWQGLQSAFSSIGSGVKLMWDGLVTAASNTAEWIKSHFSGAWQLISAWTSEKWTSIKTVVGGIWDGLKTAASSTAEWIKTGFVNEWNIISAWTSSKWTTIKTTAINIWTDLKTKAADMAEWVKTSVINAWNAVSSWTSSKWTSVKETASGIWNDLVVGASGMAEWIKTSVVGAWDTVSAWTSNKWTNVKTTATKTWNKLKTGASGMATSVKTSVTTAWDSISNWTSSKWNNIKSTAENAWSGLKSKASDMASWVESTVNTAWNNVSSWTSSKWTSIKTNAVNIWGNMKSNAQTTFTSISTFASEKWSAIRTALSGFAGWLGSGFSNAWSTAWNGIVSAFSSIFQKIKDYAKSPINSVITFINSLISKVESAVNAIRKGLSNAIKIDIPSKTLFSAFGQTVSTPRIYWKPLNLSEVTFGRIKYLAEGGILNAPTMLAPNVVGGEAGREAVLPLEQNTEWMDAVADRVVRRMGGSREVAILQSILEVLREVNDKPFTTEVTASDVQRAMNRKNVRTGTVVVPVSNG